VLAAKRPFGARSFWGFWSSELLGSPRYMFFNNVCYTTDVAEVLASRRRSDRAELFDEAVEVTLLASRALVGVAVRSLDATATDITLPQYRALVLLSSRGELNVGSLADALGIHPSSVTRLCDRLIAKGLIVRATSPESRREVTSRLSPAGRALVRTVAARRRQEIRRIVVRLDDNAQTRLIDALSSFVDAAGEVSNDAWKFGWTP
jgi:DNA-binding MarR family transcriptional regulator